MILPEIQLSLPPDIIPLQLTRAMFFQYISHSHQATHFEIQKPESENHTTILGEVLIPILQVDQIREFFLAWLETQSHARPVFEVLDTEEGIANDLSRDDLGPSSKIYGEVISLSWGSAESIFPKMMSVPKPGSQYQRLFDDEHLSTDSIALPARSIPNENPNGERFLGVTKQWLQLLPIRTMELFENINMYSAPPALIRLLHESFTPVEKGITGGRGALSIGGYTIQMLKLRSFRAKVSSLFSVVVIYDNISVSGSDFFGGAKIEACDDIVYRDQNGYSSVWARLHRRLGPSDVRLAMNMSVEVGPLIYISVSNASHSSACKNVITLVPQIILVDSSTSSINVCRFGLGQSHRAIVLLGVTVVALDGSFT
ncbi:hypothetical protein Tco_0578044 [Tanacetum coccineum]